MPDKSLTIWQVAYIEHRLGVDHGPAKIAACRDAFYLGFTVPEIVAALISLSGGYSKQSSATPRRERTTIENPKHQA